MLEFSLSSFISRKARGLVKEVCLVFSGFRPFLSSNWNVGEFIKKIIVSFCSEKVNCSRENRNQNNQNSKICDILLEPQVWCVSPYNDNFEIWLLWWQLNISFCFWEVFVIVMNNINALIIKTAFSMYLFNSPKRSISCIFEILFKYSLRSLPETEADVQRWS